MKKFFINILLVIGIVLPATLKAQTIYAPDDNVEVISITPTDWTTYLNETPAPYLKVEMIVGYEFASNATLNAAGDPTIESTSGNLTVAKIESEEIAGDPRHKKVTMWVKTSSYTFDHDDSYYLCHFNGDVVLHCTHMWINGGLLSKPNQRYFNWPLTFNQDNVIQLKAYRLPVIM